MQTRLLVWRVSKEMKDKLRECDPTYHRYFALEPFFDDKTGAVTVVLVCTNCGQPKRYDFNLTRVEPIKVIE
jgi:RNase P subunit RPR2